MATWQRFTEEAPELAEKVLARFLADKSHVLATLRADGSPRVSGSEVDFHGQDIFIGSMLNAVKARDLQRDGRFAIHAYPGVEDGGDAKIAGVAVEITDWEELKSVVGADAEPSHLFRLDLTEAVLTWVDTDTLWVERWAPGRPRVRFARPGNGPVIRTELS
ncbi:pyridoxamine 5'-phosphate oxidase family protein [Amycolatopsis sp. NPDC059657]|uniref:pyridoxamine 5'-phosphate oxidase family protein n=1 Tax=Amycolatopsis sp. NPDC059657 TaxID=3346899 RepID=UPI00366B1DF1